MPFWFKAWWYGHPFLLKSYNTLGYCYHCCGWGNEPDSGAECTICYGEGFKDVYLKTLNYRWDVQRTLKLRG